ncbi:MAG: hypothetical protein QNJ65_21300 [Xenococcaceae cyanobacterium MO_234.B1]|nr:hypothetical protein [Xenococcaceae cyanobacterium MO_234.B1]
MTHTQIQTQISSDSTCASCPKFKDYNEPRGRGWCRLFDRVAFSHHPFTLDCQLNLASDSKVKGDATDSIGQQLKETRLLLDKAKHRRSRKNQLILKAPF